MRTLNNWSDLLLWSFIQFINTPGNVLSNGNFDTSITPTVTFVYKVFIDRTLISSKPFSIFYISLFMFKV